MTTLRWGMLLVWLGCWVTSVGAAEPHLRLATTTSVDNSGLLAAILPAFEAAHGCKVDVIAVGSGKALKLAETGDVDVVLAHAPVQEEALAAAGFVVNRRELACNDFVLLGPAADPAGIGGMRDAAAALGRIAAASAPFVSRGDLSGTHMREQELWRAAGVVPSGGWYLESGRGMGEVIVMAGERQGYTLADRATWLALRGKSQLKVLVAGDARLLNRYSVMAVNPARHPHVQAQLATAFVDDLTGVAGQRRIFDFQVGGAALFFACPQP